MGCKQIIVVFFLVLLHFSCGEFIRSPISQDVPPGTNAEFTCQHSTADIIRWTVNGSLIGQNTSPDIRTASGDGVNILTITARPQYNGTVVKCVAKFDNGRQDELSAVATLQVTVSDTPTVVTTTNSPLTGNEFIRFPTSLNVTVGQRAVFQCIHSTADTIGWRVNDTALSTLNKSSISSSGISYLPDNSIQSILVIDALSEYNNTSIMCVALFIGFSPQSSTQVMLLIQGPVDAVKNLQVNSTAITWNSPPSLDLTNTDPDIAYCVEIYNITCGERMQLVDDCNVLEPNYISDFLNSGYIHEIIVTPRSNIAGAINGKQSAKHENFVFFRDIISRNRHEVVDPSTVAVDFNMQFSIKLSQIRTVWPSSYILLLTSSDGVDDSHILITTKVNVTITEEGESSVILKSTNKYPYIQSKRLWDTAVLAYGCLENILTDIIEISTHEVQVTVTTNLTGEFIISGYCIEGSLAIGILAIIYSLGHESDINYVLIACSTGYSLKQKTIEFKSMTSSSYNISTFSMGESSLPFNRSSMKPKELSPSGILIIKNYVVPSVIFNIQSTSNGVCITCNFLDSSPVDCVAVVHQRISQLSSSGLMNIESSHKFTRSGDTAYGCIEGVNLEQYQVGVIGGRQENQDFKSVNCGLGCLIGSVFGIVLLVTSAIMVILLSIILHRKNIKAHAPAADQGNSSIRVIETSKCAAYEVTTLAQQKVLMEENPAYEDTRRYHSASVY